MCQKPPSECRYMVFRISRKFIKEQVEIRCFAHGWLQVDSGISAPDAFPPLCYCLTFLQTKRQKPHTTMCFLCIFTDVNARRGRSLEFSLAELSHLNRPTYFPSTLQAMHLLFFWRAFRLYFAAAWRPVGGLLYSGVEIT